VTHVDPLDRADRQNFEILKIHDSGGRYFDKRNPEIASLTDYHHPTLFILPNKTAKII